MEELPSDQYTYVVLCDKQPSSGMGFITRFRSDVGSSVVIASLDGDGYSFIRGTWIQARRRGPSRAI
jgi:hypothetical protein